MSVGVMSSSSSRQLLCTNSQLQEELLFKTWPTFCFSVSSKELWVLFIQRGGGDMRGEEEEISGGGGRGGGGGDMRGD